MENTFNQIDQFELLKETTSGNVISKKDRCIFDFAHSSINEALVGFFTTGADSTWYVKGTLYKDSLSGVAGDTTRPIIFGDPTTNNKYSERFNGTSGLTQNTLLTSTFPLVPDNGDNRVPNIEENVLINLNTSTLNGAYRFGYIEISFKTNKQNCILGYGSAAVDNVTGITTDDAIISNTSGINYSSDDLASNINELSINIKNGKLNLSYVDEYGTNAQSFEVDGNQTVADDVWHHVVINFARPELIKGDGSRFKNRAIEFWIDGKLDKRTYDYVNDSQIFFPEIRWLAANPKKIINDNNSSVFYDGFFSQDDNFNLDGVTSNKISLGDWSDSTAFAGSIRTFAHGINFPLNQFEIQERFKFWNYNETPFRDSLNATATLPLPTVSVNKKRALKLFWNDVPNKNGIELDNNFIVDAYSVTHKNKNSATETYNIDLAKRKDYTTLPNVRVAIKDNVLIWGPGNTISLSSTQTDPNQISKYAGFEGSLINLTFSGVELNSGDRILLTNQINKSENGIWIFNGKTTPLTRPDDADSPTKINNAIVYVTEGTYTGTYWTLVDNVTSFTNAQAWTKLVGKPETTIYAQPFFTSHWSEPNGQERFIDLESDINIGDYDVIVFMNYPETFNEIKDSFGSETPENITDLYKNFITSLKNVVVGGASLYVSSKLLALDLGIVRNFIDVPQLLESSDAQSATINPFQPSEASTKYFDTHRNNKYSLVTPVPGLTDKPTYILTDFINYIPDNAHENEEYHAKYAYRQFGIQEGNEFLIPGLAINKFTENPNLPGARENYRGTQSIPGVVTPSDVLTGTVVTQLGNTYYVGSTVTGNPYDDHATTVILEPGDLLSGTGITGKVFMNCVEDGYTFSRSEYNKAQIQVVPEGETNETTNTRLWQYSTSRLNREPKTTNIRGLTKYGQTTPTNGGGGAFIQAPSNASNGIIRSATDRGNINYQSDLYPTESEEIYPLQEIPVLSMTWLGLQWLVG